MSYCDDCLEKMKGKCVASGGGTYCRFHQQELCRYIKPHCKICGKILEKGEQE